MLTREMSGAEAPDQLIDFWDRVVKDREPIRLTRRGADPLVLVAADEYDGLLTTVHLLRSPANATRLLAALERARSSIEIGYTDPGARNGHGDG